MFTQGLNTSKGVDRWHHTKKESCVFSPQGALILHFNIKNITPNCLTSIMLCHTVAVCCAIKVESVHGCMEIIWWQTDPLTNGDVARREAEKSSFKSAIWWWRSQRHYSRSSSRNLISNSIFSHRFLTMLLSLILHAEYDHFSLCSPPPNSWPKLIFPIFCTGRSLSLFSPPRFLLTHSVLKFYSLISFSEIARIHVMIFYIFFGGNSLKRSKPTMKSDISYSSV